MSAFQANISTTGFTKLMKLVVVGLRHMEICLIVYLDDILILHQEREKLILLIPLVCQMFEALGMVVNNGKSQLTSMQNIEYVPGVLGKFCFPAAGL